MLVHGHKGRSSDLNYLRSTLLSLANENEKHGEVKDIDCDVDIDEESLSSSSSSKSRDSVDFIVHSALCNEDKTDDGIEKGGKRLVDEILALLTEVTSKKTPHRRRQRYYPNVQTITLSIVGNSLGGLYARYAVSKLMEELSKSTSIDKSQAALMTKKAKVWL